MNLFFFSNILLFIFSLSSSLYTVGEKETLQLICLLVYGDSTLAKELKEFNKMEQKVTDELVPGTELQLPYLLRGYGEIFLITGDIFETKGGEKNKVIQGQKIQDETGFLTENGRGILSFEDGTRIILQENSVLFIESLRKIEPHSFYGSIKFIKGEIEFLGKGITSPGEWDFSSGDFLFTIDKPGTFFSLKSDSLKVCLSVFKGQIRIFNGEKEKFVKEGSGIIIENKEITEHELFQKPQILYPPINKNLLISQDSVEINIEWQSPANRFLIEFFEDSLFLLKKTLYKSNKNSLPFVLVPGIYFLRITPFDTTGFLKGYSLRTSFRVNKR